ncbi:MAG: hypothetical protein ACI976_001963 [Aureispira sp.]|jgi:uncharacterized protein (DUF1697 family)
MKYIALLRGINVGGKRKIKMADLQAMCAEIGLQEVQTYIQSGNIIFENAEEDASVLEKALQEQIMATFGFEVPVMVMTQAYMQQVAENNPFLKLKEDLDTKLLHVTFLAEKPAEDLIKALGEKDYGTDEFEVIENRVYLYFPNGYGRTKLTNAVFEKKLQVAATTRNWKTVGKLNIF